MIRSLVVNALACVFALLLPGIAAPLFADPDPASPDPAAETAVSNPPDAGGGTTTGGTSTSGTTMGGGLGEGNGMSFTSASGKNSISLGFWGQIRFQAYDKDEWRRTDRNDLVPPIPVENIGLTQLTFDLPFFRLYAFGNAFEKWLTYRVEISLVENDEGLREVLIPAVDPITGSQQVLVRAGTEAGDGRTVKTMDLYLDGAPLQAIGFRVGQFKVPQGRQDLVPDTGLQMTSRSIASDYFSPDRDRGIMAHGATPTSRIGYQVGVYNGTGLTARNNVDNTLAYNLRLTATSKGPYLNIESNLDAPDDFRAQGGVSWYTNGQRITQTSDPLSLLGNIQDRRVAADLQFFWSGHANLLMEYYQSSIRLDDSIQPRMEFICFGAFTQGLLTCKQQGYYVQAGWLFGGRHELSARYSMVDSDRDLDRDREYESTANYTYFFRRHTLRWSTSLTFLTLQVNSPASSGLAVQQGDESIPIISPFPNPEAFPGLNDDKNKALVTQLQWIF